MHISEKVYTFAKEIKKHNIMKEFETLTKNVLQRERQYGRLLCEWKCKGNEKNEEYGGWCLIINYKQNKWKIIPISGDDLTKGGMTAEGEFWFADYDYLEKYGETYYQPIQGAQTIASNAQVKSGYLEMANVQIVSEMVNLISITRAYESNQKVVQTIDDTLDVAVNQIARVQ